MTYRKGRLVWLYRFYMCLRFIPWFRKQAYNVEYRLWYLKNYPIKRKKWFWDD